jgi:hypothetical protein
LTSTERGQLEGQERDEKKIGQKIASDCKGGGCVEAIVSKGDGKVGTRRAEESGSGGR